MTEKGDVEKIGDVNGGSVKVVWMDDADDDELNKRFSKRASAVLMVSAIFAHPSATAAMGVFETRGRRVIFLTASVLVWIVVAIASVMSFVFGKPAESTFGKNTTYHLMSIFSFSQYTLVFGLQFYQMNIKKDFQKFYITMDKLVSRLVDANVEISYERSKQQRALLLFAVFLILIASTAYTLDFAVMKRLPLYGEFLESVIEDSRLVGLIRFGSLLASIMRQISIIMIIFYFLDTASLITYLFKQFNSAVHQTVHESEGAALNRLELFRTLHLDLVKLVKLADHTWSYLLFTEMLSLIVFELLFLYYMAASFAVEDTVSSDQTIIGVQLLFVFIVHFMTICFAHNVYEEVCAPCISLRL